jgi:sugar O-acyltransferase (sialic acid O-acetyltransferase NeuD family)
MSLPAKSIVVIGSGETADIAYEYFTYDSDRRVVAFSVEQSYLTETHRNGLPVVALEQLIALYPPETYDAFVAVSYVQLNRLRERLFKQVQSWGYSCASYISSHAFVWRTVQVGQNCMIFENNVLQHGVKIEDNVILWSGNHVGHQTIIRQSAYVASHVVISGYCEVGPRCFIGVNATVVDNIKIAQDCLIGAGAVITKNTDVGGIYQGNPSIKREGISSLKYFKVAKE